MGEDFRKSNKMSRAQEVMWTTMVLVFVVILSFFFYEKYGGINQPELIVTFVVVALLVAFFARKWVRENVGEDGKLKGWRR